jgi:hypothetical protein
MCENRAFSCFRVQRKLHDAPLSPDSPGLKERLPRDATALLSRDRKGADISPLSLILFLEAPCPPNPPKTLLEQPQVFIFAQPQCSKIIENLHR